MPTKKTRINTKPPYNNNADLAVKYICQWHYDRNLIDEATDESQTKKLFEEFIELVAANMPDATPKEIATKVINMVKELYADNRIKTVPAGQELAAKKDALGDMNVVMINIIERNQWTFYETLMCSYNEIKDRKGIALNGTFIKAVDLPAYKAEIENAGFNYDQVIEDNT
ncbi:DNA binding protein [Vibrio virus vB_VspP_SBP1]|uniref:DNA binding protein n=1 Tax=Vibrio virus vB_VspP_SBP1 TaxID=2500581 RepID=A0A3T0IIF9_9CAUD|nr:MazG-like pyrophosphatase [Vibrio virus vB_VspP_SBP1]AZU99617.1 DNA binding protein [Vibrio virus vB_VspP_SBP1]